MLLCIGLILSICFCLLKIFSIRDNFEFGYIHCNSGGNFLFYIIDRNKVLCQCTIKRENPFMAFSLCIFLSLCLFLLCFLCSGKIGVVLYKTLTWHIFPLPPRFKNHDILNFRFLPTVGHIVEACILLAIYWASPCFAE